MVTMTITWMFVSSRFFGVCRLVPEEWQQGEYGACMQLSSVASALCTAVHLSLPACVPWCRTGLQYNCPTSHYNDLASLYFSQPTETIRKVRRVAHMEHILHTCMRRYSAWQPMSMGRGVSVVACATFQWRPLHWPRSPTWLAWRLRLGWRCPVASSCHPSWCAVVCMCTSLLCEPTVCQHTMHAVHCEQTKAHNMCCNTQVGSSFGAMYGLILMDVAPASWSIQPGLYAIVAATAVLGGVFRSSISLVVIVVEGTRGINFLFGIIIAVVVSNYVAHLIHFDGVYESELERDGNVFYLRSEPPHALRHTTAQQV